MGRLLIGCLALVGLMAIVGGVGTYLLVVRPIHAAYVASREATERFRAVEAIEAEVRNVAEFEPPGDGVMTPQQVERFVTVQRAIVAAIGPRQDELRARFAQLNGATVDEGVSALRAAFDAIDSLAELAEGTKRTQVDALNATDFSLAEYAWVRRQFFAAIGVVLIPIDVGKLSMIPSAFADERPDVEALGGRTETSDENVSESNRELVTPYREEAQRWIPHAVLGL